ncbi:MAG: hypothetical protein ABW175_15385 [Bradyrhizobium sp.]
MEPGDVFAGISPDMPLFGGFSIVRDILAGERKTKKAGSKAGLFQFAVECTQ